MLGVPPGVARPGGAEKATLLEVVSICILFELSVSITLTAAASLVWAIAAPKWLEKVLESLAKKTMWFLLILFFGGVGLMLACLTGMSILVLILFIGGALILVQMSRQTSRRP